MGQGTTTGLTTREELDADWAKVKTEFAPADVERYKIFSGAFRVRAALQL